MKGRLTLGLLLIAAGFVAAIVIAVPPFVDLKERIESFPKTRLSEGAVELEAREYDVYLDVPSGTGDAGWTLRMRDAEGREVPLRSTSSSITYDWFGREGARIGKVRITAPGRHVVRGTGPAGADVVFAEEVFGDMGRSVLYAAGSLALLGSAGVLLIVLGFSRREPREPRRWP